MTPDYEASVLHRFTDLPQGALLNGIVYHDGGYLLVVADDRIYKVPVANPAGTTQVNVSEPVGGQDGIVLTDDGRLVATSNSATEPRLVAFTSNDNWTSAQRAGVAMLNGQATTAAIVGDEIWAVHPHFADAEPPTIERGPFQYAAACSAKRATGSPARNGVGVPSTQSAWLVAKLRRQEVAALAARELEHAVLGRAGRDGHAQHGAVARRGDAQRDHRARQRRARQREPARERAEAAGERMRDVEHVDLAPLGVECAVALDLRERLEQHCAQERRQSACSLVRKCAGRSSSSRRSVSSASGQR